MPPPAADAPAPGHVMAELDLMHRTAARLGDELIGLRRAMESRALIEQAKGALRVVTGLSSDQAFALLATRSQNTNRKLSEVAADVLAGVGSADRLAAVLGALSLPDQRREQAPGATGGWRTRRRWDALALAISDPEQLLALADLGENLAAAPGRGEVLDVLIHTGADALGAFGASVTTLRDDAAAPGTDTVGLELGSGGASTLTLHAVHPVAEVLREGGTRVLSRAELALRYPDHPRPDRLGGVVVLSVARLARPAAWSLYYDSVLPADRGTRAFLDRAARLAAGALTRAG